MNSWRTPALLLILAFSTTLAACNSSSGFRSRLSEADRQAAAPVVPGLGDAARAVRDPGIDKNAEVAIVENRAALIATELKRQVAVAAAQQLAAELMRKTPSAPPQATTLRPWSQSIFGNHMTGFRP